MDIFSSPPLRKSGFSRLASFLAIGMLSGMCALPAVASCPFGLEVSFEPSDVLAGCNKNHQGKPYSSAQIAQLQAIADQCHLKGSDAIFLARSLYFRIDPDAAYDDAALCSIEPELLLAPAQPPFTAEVFPNPARDWAVVNSGWPEAESALLTVYNSLGVPVLQAELPLFDGQGEVDLSQLPSGWYSLLLQAEGERKVARLVIAR
jgi:hypothetical protein